MSDLDDLLQRLEAPGRAADDALDRLAAEMPSAAIDPSERQGVYVHSFKCLGCGLHFMTFSWRPDRHRVGTITCPECGEREAFLHWRRALNESAERRDSQEEERTEIDAVHPWPGSAMCEDSTLDRL